jgi:carbonic anhydrase
MQRIAVIATLAAALALPLYAAEPAHPRLHTFESTKPDALWNALMAGNHRYVTGSLAYRTLRERRSATTGYQDPPVTVLTCADSRVPPELIFDHTVGDLFVVRVAGNIADDFELASLEFAIANGYTRLIVVMGHEACGAVKGALEAGDPPTPSLVALVTRIRESLHDEADHASVRTAVEANTRHTAQYLTAHSTVIRDAVAQGKVKIVSAYYAFDGTVTKLE